MNGPRSTTTHLAGLWLNFAGALVLVAGAVIGWVVPRLSQIHAFALVAGLDQRIGATHIDVSSYLGADIAALSVTIAIVIGFTVTILQMAGQAHSLSLVRGIFTSTAPFLVCWGITMAVALSYFLIPPMYVAQLWQLFAWFGAVTLLMVGYTWDLPWRLSGEYVGRWAIRALRGRPVAEWEAVEAYSVLQTSIASASGRGDLGTARAIMLRLGRFLLTFRDRRAEAANTYHRGRYRALKSLLSGCAQGATDAPNASAYYLGYVQAGILLQAVACGHPMDDPEHDLFTGVVRTLRANADHVNPLWTGLRHALCRPSDGGRPYLVDYWLEHDTWPVDDPRRVERIAAALARFHAACAAVLRSTQADTAPGQSAEMATDLYRDITEHLGPTIGRERHRITSLRLPDLPLSLLDAVQTGIMRGWPDNAPETKAARVEVVNAYETYRAVLGAALTRSAV